MKANMFHSKLKIVLISSIVCMTLVHTLLITIALAPLVGIWGLCMQLIYSRFVDDFPFVRINSPKFVVACGMILKKIM